MLKQNGNVDRPVSLSVDFRRETTKHTKMTRKDALVSWCFVDFSGSSSLFL